MGKLKKINRGWSKSKGYWILFVAKDTSTVDHAFVVFAMRDRKKGHWVDAEGYGLYPNTSTKKLVLGTVPGKIVNENIKTITSANNILAVAVTKKIYNYAYENVSVLSKYPFDYNLFSINCVNFTNLIAKAISLTTPEITSTPMFPQTYISHLISMND